MFRTISIAAFVITLVGIALNCIVSPCKECWGHPLRKLVHLFTLLFFEQKLSPLGILKKLFYLLALLCFVVLFVAGFYPNLILGETISSYWLMLHATFAPVFAVCLAVLAVMWANIFRLDKSDCPLLQRILRRAISGSLSVTRDSTSDRIGGERRATSDEPGLGLKITFWLIVSLALPLILSITLSMFQLFGTDWQEFLLAAHRYTALAFAVVAIVHIYLVIRSQMRQ